MRALFERHGEDVALGLRALGDRGPILLIDEQSHLVSWGAFGERPLEPLVDHALRLGDPGRLLGCGSAVDAEHLLLERASMVERQDVQRPLVPDRHLCIAPFSVWPHASGWTSAAAASARARAGSSRPAPGISAFAEAAPIARARACGQPSSRSSAATRPARKASPLPTG